MMLNIRKIILILILISSSYNVFAFSGISPAKTTLNFYPNEVSQISYQVFGYNEIGYEISCPELISIGSITKEEAFHRAIASVKFPDSMPEPGKKACGIKFIEKSMPRQLGNIATQTGVGSTIIINVPYPGKYATIGLEAPNTKKDEPILFKVVIDNLGEEALNDVKADIRIEDIEEGKLVGLMSTSAASVEPFKSEEAYQLWETTGIEPARYRAIATLDYGGDKPATSEARFMIGKRFVEFKGATRNGTSNKINQFDITVENWWGERLGNVYADVAMYNASGISAGTFRTVSTELNSWEAKQISGFWNAEQWGAGRYAADIKIKYEGQETPVKWDFELISPEKKEAGLEIALGKLKSLVVSPIFILMAIILAIVIIDVFWLKRRKEGQNEKK